MHKQKKAKKEMDTIYLNTRLSKEDNIELEKVSYITEEKERKPSSEKILHWLLNYSKRDDILLIMKHEEAQREMIKMTSRIEKMKIKG